MAIIKCYECGKDVSTAARACPTCGAKVRKPPKSVGLGGAVFALFVGYVIYAAVSGSGGATRQPSDATVGVSSPAGTSAPPMLEVQSWRCDTEYGFMFVRGEVKNVSSRKLENVTAVGEFRTAAGELVKAEDALLDYNPLMPGQTSPFKAGGTGNPEIQKCGLAFKYLIGGGEIAYTEKSKGKAK